VKGSIRIFPEWKTDRAVNGIQIWWLITVGHLYWRHQQKNARDKVWQNDFLMLHLYIFR
jgi:hypothetical protein